MSDMLLSRIDVENFKSIRRATINCRQLTVIIGENSAGKSSLLQAIFLLAQIAQGRSSPDLVSLNGMELNLGDFKDVVHMGDANQSVELALAIPFGTSIAQRGWRAGSLRGRPASRRWNADQEEDEATWRLTLKAPASELGVAQVAEIHITHLRDGLDLVLRPNDDRSEAIEMYEHSRRIGLVRSLPTSRGQLVSEVDAVTAFTARLTRSTHDVFSDEMPDWFPAAMVTNGLPVELYALRDESESLAETWVRLVRRRTEIEYSRARHRPRRLETALDLESEVPRSTRAAERLFPEFRRWVDELDRTRNIEMFPPVTVPALPDDLYTALAEAELTIVVELSRLLANIREERPAIASYSPEPLEAAAVFRSLLSNSIHYLGPLREDPSPSYRPGKRGTVATLGMKGEFTVAILNSYRDQATACPLENGNTQRMTLEDAVNYWAERFGLAGKVRTINKGRPGIEAELTDLQTGAKRDLTSVGVGVSQLLPVIVLCLIAQPGELVMIEQPELHLHPAPQQVLGDFLLRIAESGRQLIVETHSEYLVNRLRLRIAMDELDTLGDIVHMWYATRKEGRTRFELLKPNRFGSFEEWPEGFFDQAPRDAEEILRAAARKRRFVATSEPRTEKRVPRTIPIHADYHGTRVIATFDPETEGVRVLSEPVADRAFISPSGAATEVVRRLNPDVRPNRNGWNFWIVTETGEVLQSVRRRTAFNTK